MNYTYARLTSGTEGIEVKRQNPGLRKIRLEVENVPLDTIITCSYPIDNGKLYEIPTYGLTMYGSNYLGENVIKRYLIYRFGVYHNDGSKKDGNGKPGLYVAGLYEEQTHVIKAWDRTYEVHSAESNENGAWVVFDSFKIHDGPDELPTTEWVYKKICRGVRPRLFASIGCLEVCGVGRGFSQFNSDIIELSGSTKSRAEALIEIGEKKLITIHYKAAEVPPLIESKDFFEAE
ncbi:MAG TPA: hypothetical protein VKO63_03605 [Chitinispirillaceae bacterium]|nr:hypothetical protein [Chitinispirillaceae bacterium]